MGTGIGEALLVAAAGAAASTAANALITDLSSSSGSSSGPQRMPGDETPEEEAERRKYKDAIYDKADPSKLFASASMAQQAAKKQQQIIESTPVGLRGQGLQDGGVVQDHHNLLSAIQQFRDGGTVRSGSSDARAGGEIRGPQSQSGRDNQLIAVAGGEGILPADVMDVAGVPELVQSLIQSYHTPIRNG